MTMMNIPLGFRFSPTDEELISYLLRRGMGLELNPSGAQHQHILERHLYGEKADPWHVFQDVDDSHWDLLEGDKRVIYVITKLSKISNGKTRIARRAGCGTWSGQTPPKKIFNESSGQWVGTKRMLSFERSGDRVVVRDPHDRHHWMMHEYSLDGIYNSKNHCQIKHQDYVICRITRVFDKTRCIQERLPVSSGKKRSSQEEEEVARCDKKQRKSISGVGHSITMQPEARMMFSEIPLPSPGSIGFGEWTEEDLSFLNDLLL